jgi:hypothetical protein
MKDDDRKPVENDELTPNSAPAIFWTAVATLTGSLVCCGLWVWLVLFKA